MRGKLAKRLARGLTDLVESRRNELLDEARWERMVYREVESALGHGVSAELIPQAIQDRAAERQVAQVILERSEARDDLALYTEGGNAVRDHLLSLRGDLEDCPAQRLKGAALGLVDSAQVLINLFCGHD